MSVHELCGIIQSPISYNICAVPPAGRAPRIMLTVAPEHTEHSMHLCPLDAKCPQHQTCTATVEVTCCQPLLPPTLHTLHLAQVTMRGDGNCQVRAAACAYQHLLQTAQLSEGLVAQLLNLRLSQATGGVFSSSTAFHASRPALECCRLAMCMPYF